jgi:hypothetical protein
VLVPKDNARAEQLRRTADRAVDFEANGQAAARHAGKQRQAGNAGIAAGF